MTRICKVTINGEVISAQRGDLLLDAALMNGIEIPHDCRSGYCGTCQVRVIAGRCFGAGQSDSDVVQACQTRVISDLTVIVEKVPEITELSGTIVNLVELASDIVEVCIETRGSLDYLPGQYLAVQFRGYPTRNYSPTVPLEPDIPDLIRFHVRRLPKSRVSSALGRKIKSGHRVKIMGPFGTAYLRANAPGRVVLVSSGTGFAPIWAIAEAAIKEKPKRQLVLVAGARDLESLYMIPALCRLALFPGVRIIPTVQTSQSITTAVRFGPPIDYLPPLGSGDTVYAAGSPRLVQAVAHAAAASGATCFSDPFLPATGGDDAATLLSRTFGWLTPSAKSPRAALYH
ncbi:MAG: 2Fe-2S iron-sulfur cluster-binding protein [Xanthobacteraceae bacterium]